MQSSDSNIETSAPAQLTDEQRRIRSLEDEVRRLEQLDQHEDIAKSDAIQAAQHPRPIVGMRDDFAAELKAARFHVNADKNTEDCEVNFTSFDGVFELQIISPEGSTFRIKFGEAERWNISFANAYGGFSGTVREK